MVYKLFLEDGNYRDINSHEPRNLLEVDIAYTPDGINIGWLQFDSIEQAMIYFNIELVTTNDKL